MLEGRFRFSIDGKESVREAGEDLVAPKGVPHTYRIGSPEGGRFLALVVEWTKRSTPEVVFSVATNEKVVALSIDVPARLDRYS